MKLKKEAGHPFVPASSFLTTDDTDIVPTTDDTDDTDRCLTTDDTEGTDTSLTTEGTDTSLKGSPL